MLIKDIADCERPYEKAVEQGVEALSDAELLATILRTGSKDSSSIDLANKVLNNHYLYKGLIGLNYMDRDDLLAIPGIGNTKATQLLAISELSARMVKQKLRKAITFEDAKSVATYYQEKCKYLSRERMYLMLFNSSGVLIKEVLLSEGTMDKTLISNREIFIQALKYEAVKFILVHNHPSGNVVPSHADVQSTYSARDAGKLLGVTLADHIVVGYDSYYSMRERGIIK